jgi:hypothetical protein
MPMITAMTMQRYARIGGLIYLAIICLGLFGEVFVRSSLIVSGDASATAGNIVGSQALWRAGIAGDLLMHVLDVPLIVILYFLLKPVSHSLAMLSALLNVVQTCILATNKLTLVGALVLLGPSTLANGLVPQEAHALAYFAIKLHGYGFGVGLIFFGFSSMVRGYLIAKSGLLPWLLGVLLGIAGICYVVNSAALLLHPPLASALFPAILLPAFIGELALALWLLAKGVDASAWQRLTSANDSGIKSDA